jgi:hypothetical protein
LLNFSAVLYLFLSSLCSSSLSSEWTLSIMTLTLITVWQSFYSAIFLNVYISHFPCPFIHGWRLNVILYFEWLVL